MSSAGVSFTRPMPLIVPPATTPRITPAPRRVRTFIGIDTGPDVRKAAGDVQAALARSGAGPQTADAGKSNETK